MIRLTDERKLCIAVLVLGAIAWAIGATVLTLVGFLIACAIAVVVIYR